MTGEGLPAAATAAGAAGRRSAIASSPIRTGGWPGRRPRTATERDELVFLSEPREPGRGASSAERAVRRGRAAEGPPFRPNLQRARGDQRGLRVSLSGADGTVVQLGPARMRGRSNAAARVRGTRWPAQWGYDPKRCSKTPQAAPRIRKPARTSARRCSTKAMLHPAAGRTEPTAQLSIARRSLPSGRRSRAAPSRRARARTPALGEMLCGQLRDEARIAPATDADGTAGCGAAGLKLRLRGPLTGLARAAFVAHCRTRKTRLAPPPSADIASPPGKG